ncbi:MAG TPA: TMEM165/GDT1 family protein [Allosphingosinicella sp.]
METLLPAFVAALLAEWGDKTQLVLIALAARYGRPGPLLAGVAVGALTSGLFAGFAGTLVHGTVTLRALSLLLGIALLFAGVTGFFARKPPVYAATLAGPAFLAAALGIFLAEVGDRTQFIAFAFAAQYDSALLPAFGSAAGVLVASVPAVLLGPQLARQVPVRAIRTGAAILFLLAGLVVALNALRLV